MTPIRPDRIRQYAHAALIHEIGSIDMKTKDGWTACGKWFLLPEFTTGPSHAYVDELTTCLWCVASRRPPRWR